MVYINSLINKKDTNTLKNYNTRKATIFKKAKELSTLCNTDVLLIFYGPDNPNIPQTWCSKPDSNTVIRKLYEKKVVRGCGEKRDQSIKELGFDEVLDLNNVSGKIAVPEQRIDVLKGCNDFFYGSDFFDYMLDDTDRRMKNNNGLIDGFGFGDAISEVMMDISDIDMIKFDGVEDEDDLDLIRRLADIDDSAFGSEVTCVDDGDLKSTVSA